jgi:hypothetical protein
MGYRNKTIGAINGGLGCAEYSTAAEKSLLVGPKMAKKTLTETLKERSRNARGIGQRSVLMYSTNNDGGMANSRWVGEGG